MINANSARSIKAAGDRFSVINYAKRTSVVKALKHERDLDLKVVDAAGPGGTDRLRINDADVRLGAIGNNVACPDMCDRVAVAVHA